MRRTRFIAAILGSLSLCGASQASPGWSGHRDDSIDAPPAVRSAPAVSVYIVRADSVRAAVHAVRRAGGHVMAELPIVSGVSARLSAQQANTLRRNRHLELFADAPLKTQGGPIIDQYARIEVGADQLGSQGFFGNGVTVAILDSGIWASWDNVKNNLSGKSKILKQYNAITNQVGDSGSDTARDDYGHGSHIASLNWILANRATYNVRVLNLSFGAKPQSFYWNDPIDQAVMKLWQAGVVVVASAGNYGPTAQSITVPGNTPYVITVGAMTDNYTPTNPADDGVTSFSSTGPTYEGFVKPDLFAPGGHMIGSMNAGTMSIAKTHPEFATANNTMFVMSGTSQSAAVVSGIVALMLQANPSLTPNLVKCRLVASASSSVNSSGKAAYSIFQQGAGMVNAYAAVYSQAAGCANQGLNIANDIAGTMHYGGPAHQDAATKQFYLVDLNGNRMQSDGYLWNNGYLWNQSTVAPASAPMVNESWNNQE